MQSRCKSLSQHDWSHVPEPWGTERCWLVQCLAAHRKAVAGLDLKGRIYISSQGINAQFSGPASDAISYSQWVEAQPEFQVSPRKQGHMLMVCACSMAGMHVLYPDTPNTTTMPRLISSLPIHFRAPTHGMQPATLVEWEPALSASC